MDFLLCCFSSEGHEDFITEHLKTHSAIIFDSNCKRGNQGRCQIFTNDENLVNKIKTINKTVKAKINSNPMVIESFNDITSDIIFSRIFDGIEIYSG